MRVGVIFGGRSAEHEVSIASARSVTAALAQRHEVVPVYVDRQGIWHLVQDLDGLSGAAEHFSLLSLGDRNLIARVEPNPLRVIEAIEVDVFFPLIHGPYGEDGRLQGLMEMLGMPYVGCGVLSSALAMDKAMTKAVLQRAGLPQVDYRVVRRQEWLAHRKVVMREVVTGLQLPVFIKPANLGSSVGITRAADPAEVEYGLDEAFRYDPKALVERAVNCRELECGILGHSRIRPSVVGEVRPRGIFYDYESKYSPGGCELLIPAPVSQMIASQVQDMAVRAFKEIEGSGMARIDFFYEESTQRLYINEINTIPGFTSTSMYPKLFEATGVSYLDLLDQLLEAALERHAQAHDRPRI